MVQLDQPIKWDDAMGDLTLLGTRYALTRQVGAIKAAVELARANLGHYSVCFVRPAFEEFLWVMYLSTLDRRDAHDVFHAMALDDSMRQAQAADDFFRPEEMINQGFPQRFREFVDLQFDANKVDVTALGERLGWPRTRSGFPSMKWIATQVGEDKFYAYLYAATSRGVHFSAGEVLRHAWGQPGKHVDVEDVDYQVFFSDYALYELTYLFLQTGLAAEPWHAQVLSGQSDDECRKYLLDFAKLGRIPIMTASEYELFWKKPQ